MANARLDIQDYILEGNKILDEIKKILYDNQEYI
jgi:hypothetical protein